MVDIGKINVMLFLLLYHRIQGALLAPSPQMYKLHENYKHFTIYNHLDIQLLYKFSVYNHQFLAGAAAAAAALVFSSCRS